MSSHQGEPTPRQVLYGLVGGGFLAVTAVLTAGAAAAGVGPMWWTVVMASTLLVAALWTVLNWRRTMPVLLLSIGLFLAWTVGTLVVS
jgi:hypothetical protein